MDTTFVLSLLPSMRGYINRPMMLGLWLFTYRLGNSRFLNLGKGGLTVIDKLWKI